METYMFSAALIAFGAGFMLTALMLTALMNKS